MIQLFTFPSRSNLFWKTPLSGVEYRNSKSPYRVSSKWTNRPQFLARAHTEQKSEKRRYDNPQAFVTERLVIWNYRFKCPLKLRTIERVDGIGITILRDNVLCHSHFIASQFLGNFISPTIAANTGQICRVPTMMRLFLHNNDNNYSNQNYELSCFFLCISLRLTDMRVQRKRDVQIISRWDGMVVFKVRTSDPVTQDLIVSHFFPIRTPG